MTEILVTMPIRDAESREKLTNAFPDGHFTFASFDALTGKELEKAEILVGNVMPDQLAMCRSLKFYQLQSAGANGYPEKLPSGVVMANASGAFGLAISEHMLGMLLCMMKKLNLYYTDQEKACWSDHGSVQSIAGSSTLVVGMGDIGGEFAMRMHALGSHVTGIRRKGGTVPPYAEAVLTPDAMLSCLQKADIVADCLPGTAATRRIFDAEAFSAMKPGAWFLNVGRGSTVDTDALCDALESGHLAGAALDVTDPEPLPRDHRLWHAPNVMITPHVSGGHHLRLTYDRIVDLMARNLKRWHDGEEPENIVDLSAGY